MPDVNQTTTPEQTALEAQNTTTGDIVQEPTSNFPSVQTLPGAVNTTEPPKSLTKKQKKKNEADRKRLTTSFHKMIEKNGRKMAQMKVEMERLKERVGKKEFSFLKTLATVSIPAKTDEKGEVIQAASSYINYDLLFAEGKNMITILRESRIKAGKRKRTTGSRSSRRAQKARLAAIIARNKTLEDQSKNQLVKEPETGVTGATSDTVTSS